MKKFSKLHKGVVRAADAYFRTNPSVGTDDERLAKKQLFADLVTRCYKAPSVRVVASPNGGKTRFAEGLILIPMKKGSNLGFFRALREATHGDDASRTKGWSHSLYKAVRPELYAKNVKGG